MKTHITTLNNMAGTASLAHRRVLKVAQSIGCHEMGLSFYPLKPDYAKEIDKRLDGIIAPLNYGDIVIFQYPSWIGVNYDESFVNKIKSYRDTKLIIFVQDIQKLMFDSEQAILDMEIKTLNKADLLILPSKKMHRYLKENGLDEKPVIYQTIWDMPSDICFVDHAVTRCFHFAGNYNRFPFLAEYHGKTPIYQYDANKPDRENDDSFCWRGYFEQEKLMHELSKGGFGLVWSDDEYFDRYYSMNQPYKLGTNLAAGIPVIVKRGCVHEKFVERNGLGYAVDTLDEADKLVQSITDAEYIKLCEDAGVDIIFHPEPEEMYADGFCSYVDMNGLTTELCGKTRPIHFRGVQTVVLKLFHIVTPDRAYFGQKDAQQLAVIKRMVKDLNVDTEIIGCPIIREEDGLAKSSRNTYLSEDERQAALVLSRSLKIGKQLVEDGEKSAKAIKDAITAEINKEPLARIDYVDVVDFETITPVDEIKGTTLVAIAVYIGKTRLIDNFIA